LPRGPVLALIAGAAAAIAHPPFGFLLGLLGYGLLFGLVDQSHEARPLRSAFWRGWLAGGAYFLIGCWWVAEAFLVDAANQGWMAPFAAAFLAGGLGLFWGVAGFVYRLVRPGHPAWKALVFAGVLSATEWLRGHVLTGFPWNLPGETWRAGTAPSQAASALGAYGLTWLTLAAMAALGALALAPRDRRAWPTAGLGVFVIIGLYAYGADRLTRALPSSPDAPVVRIVQANVPQQAKYDSDRALAIAQRYLRLTAQIGQDRRPDIIVWPEGALPGPANDILDPQAWTRSAVANTISPSQTLLMGAWRIDTRARPQAYYNSLFVLGRDAGDLKIEAVYDKFRLVPFGEYLPLEQLMGSLGIKKLVHVGDGFSAGPVPQPVEAPGVPVMQPLICYEALFPGFTRNGARKAGLRPRWIVNVSDDAWFGRTSGPWQHLNLASYCAIEEGLPMVRATPTGVSAMIDAYGRSRPELRLSLGAEGVIDAPLPAALPPTLYDRYGDMPFLVMLALSLLAVLPRFSPVAGGRLQI
jgi:apolipoprotein N-acyltransferase